MTRATTVIDCREQCRKMEAECLQSGRSPEDCKKERIRCEKTCMFK